MVRTRCSQNDLPPYFDKKLGEWPTTTTTLETFRQHSYQQEKYVKVKVKLVPKQAIKAQRKVGAYLYSLLNLGARGGWVGDATPWQFTSGIDSRYPLYRFWPQGRYGRLRKISPPSEFDPWTVQPVASRYTDWVIPAHTRKAMLF